jgi:hypothetical protein
MLERKGMRVEYPAQYAQRLAAIRECSVEDDLRLSHQTSVATWRVTKLTCTSLDLRYGFVMYHVDDRKVSANSTSSFLPDSSKL